MIENKKDISLLQRWQHVVDAHEKSIKGFLNLCKPICFEYEKSKLQACSESFNVFSLVSDLYYRENFHSDIIKFFLDTKETHAQGSIFLEQFIKMLQQRGQKIDFQDYQDATAIREEGKIDILIKSENSKHAIIIENKINDAGDMPRQLPRYFDDITQNYHYQIDSIVYLPLDFSKSPDMFDWTETDKANVCPLLNIIPAYDKSRINLVDNWLKPVQEITNDIDVLSTLRQYSKLIRKLNANAMDIVILEKFYEEIKDGNNLKTAQSIRNMLNEIPQFLARRIFEKYRNICAPFSKVWIYNYRDAVFEGANILGQYIKMDILCSEEGYEILFYSPEDHQPDEAAFDEILSKVKSLNGFRPVLDQKCRLTNNIDFTDEAGLIAFIDEILVELSKVKNS